MLLIFLAKLIKNLNIQQPTLKSLILIFILETILNVGVN